LPQITSSIAVVSSALRALIAFSATADSRGALTSCSAPSGRPLPRTVRTAS
jgi:hypothetical protein